jgi:MoaA/NifB/PqqE/SkfB family radical SAM enzyme
MHASTQRNKVPNTPQSPSLKHLWLELTRRCNLQCVHCYANAGPDQPLSEGLTTVDWLQLLESARDQGCASVQFIGGEPLLYPDLDILLLRARSLGYDEIEVFTNGTRITSTWVQLFTKLRIRLALSFYATSSEGHEAVTGSRGSYHRTLRGINLAVASGLHVRVGIIQVKQTDKEIEQVKEILTSLGVTDVKVDRVRSIGRADGNISFLQPVNQLAELCGACSDGKLCITTSGNAYPCIMARSWLVGNARDGLSNILESNELATFREQQHYLSNEATASCGPDNCGPYCRPNCNPYENCSPCNPSCTPPCGPLDPRVN